MAASNSGASLAQRRYFGYVLDYSRSGYCSLVDLDSQTVLEFTAADVTKYSSYKNRKKLDTYRKFDIVEYTPSNVKARAQNIREAVEMLPRLSGGGDKAPFNYLTARDADAQCLYADLVKAAKSRGHQDGTVPPFSDIFVSNIGTQARPRYRAAFKTAFLRRKPFESMGVGGKAESVCRLIQDVINYVAVAKKGSFGTTRRQRGSRSSRKGQVVGGSAGESSLGSGQSSGGASGTSGGSGSSGGSAGPVAFGCGGFSASLPNSIPPPTDPAVDPKKAAGEENAASTFAMRFAACKTIHDVFSTFKALLGPLLHRKLPASLTQEASDAFRSVLSILDQLRRKRESELKRLSIASGPVDLQVERLLAVVPCIVGAAMINLGDMREKEKAIIKTFKNKDLLSKATAAVSSDAASLEKERGRAAAAASDAVLSNLRPEQPEIPRPAGYPASVAASAAQRRRIPATRTVTEFNALVKDLVNISEARIKELSAFSAVFAKGLNRSELIGRVGLENVGGKRCPYNGTMNVLFPLIADRLRPKELQRNLIHSADAEEEDILIWMAAVVQAMTTPSSHATTTKPIQDLFIRRFGPFPWSPGAGFPAHRQQDAGEIVLHLLQILDSCLQGFAKTHQLTEVRRWCCRVCGNDFDEKEEQPAINLMHMPDDKGPVSLRDLVMESVAHKYEALKKMSRTCPICQVPYRGKILAPPLWETAPEYLFVQNPMVVENVGKAEIELSLGAEVTVLSSFFVHGDACYILDSVLFHQGESFESGHWLVVELEGTNGGPRLSYRLLNDSSIILGAFTSDDKVAGAAIMRYKRLFSPSDLPLGQGLVSASGGPAQASYSSPGPPPLSSTALSAKLGLTPSPSSSSSGKRSGQRVVNVGTPSPNSSPLAKQRRSGNGTKSVGAQRFSTSTSGASSSAGFGASFSKTLSRAGTFVVESGKKLAQSLSSPAVASNPSLSSSLLDPSLTVSSVWAALQTQSYYPPWAVISFPQLHSTPSTSQINLGGFGSPTCSSGRKAAGGGGSPTEALRRFRHQAHNIATRSLKRYYARKAARAQRVALRVTAKKADSARKAKERMKKAGVSG